MSLASSPLEMPAPEGRSAVLPAERRGLARDEVRMMVARRWSGEMSHDRFHHLDRYLGSGDVLIVNTSATLPASVDARGSGESAFRVHFSSPTQGGLWQVEVRHVDEGGATSPGWDIEEQDLSLPFGVRIRLLARSTRSPRLWLASIEGDVGVEEYLGRHGRPITYGPGARLPIDEYQTIFSTEPGSAEMPSAARPFTPELVTSLITRGVTVLPIVLHAGVSSFEVHEPPGEERYRVPETTAETANLLRSRGGRVIAVGTTVVRALETVSGSDGTIHPGSGTTELVITPDRGVRAVDGMITGWHEPRSSHLLMLEAVGGRALMSRAYEEAVRLDYLWHEFGDSLLILP